jgi:hypothetical protein
VHVSIGFGRALCVHSDRYVLPGIVARAARRASRVFLPGPEQGFRGCCRQDGNVENALQAAAGHRGSGASAGMTRRPAVPGARPSRRPVCQRTPCRFAADLASPRGAWRDRFGRIFIRRAVRPVLRSLRRLRPPAPSCLLARAEGGTEVKRSEGRCAVPISHCGPLPDGQTRAVPSGKKQAVTNRDKKDSIRGRMADTGEPFNVARRKTEAATGFFDDLSASEPAPRGGITRGSRRRRNFPALSRSTLSCSGGLTRSSSRSPGCPPSPPGSRSS